MPIHFFNEDIKFSLPSPNSIRNWIVATAEKEGFLIRGLNFIFCSDKYLSNINQEYLNHSSLTDIITFNNGDPGQDLEGDIFISIDRVKDNAQELEVEFLDELYRVIIHGVLHLCGYTDKTSEEKAVMRGKEDFYLSLRMKTSDSRST